MYFTMQQELDGKASLRLDGVLCDVLTPSDAKRVIEAWGVVGPYVQARLALLAAELHELAKELS